MPKYLLTNEVIADDSWKMLVSNPSYSEDLTSKQSPGKAAVCTNYCVRLGVDNATSGDFPVISLPKRGWRTEGLLNGSFAAGNWTFRVRFESTTKYGFSIKVACRLSRSANADGSDATLIIVSQSPNAIAIPAAAGGSVSDSWTWSAPVVTLSNEYLFAEFRIHIEVAGGNAACECAFACDENPAVADESVEAPAFTPSGAVETIVAKDFPMVYRAEPVTVKELRSRVSGATVTKIANPFPQEIVKAGKARDLRSRWS